MKTIEVNVLNLDTVNVMFEQKDNEINYQEREKNRLQKEFDDLRNDFMILEMDRDSMRYELNKENEKLKKELKQKNEWVKLHQRNLEFAVEKRNAVQEEKDQLLDDFGEERAEYNLVLLEKDQLAKDNAALLGSLLVVKENIETDYCFEVQLYKLNYTWKMLNDILEEHCSSKYSTTKPCQVCDGAGEYETDHGGHSETVDCECKGTR
jgi:hypothetical protein